MFQIGLIKNFWLTKLKILCHGYILLAILGGETVGMFYKKELQKTNQTEFRIEKVINKKGDKLYVKWKGYDKLFNSCIDKKYIFL